MSKFLTAEEAREISENRNRSSIKSDFSVKDIISLMHDLINLKCHHISTNNQYIKYDPPRELSKEEFIEIIEHFKSLGYKVRVGFLIEVVWYKKISEEV